MADLGNLVRRLQRLEAAQPRSTQAPAMITVLAFQGEHEAAHAYASEVRAHFHDAPPHVEVLQHTVPRPVGLRPAWASPRAWLDYLPSPQEVSDLRPDLRPSPVPRADWSPTHAAE